MNEGKIDAPATGNTGITTTSGEVNNIEIVDDMIHFKRPFKCLKCGRNIDSITKNYKCPYCRSRL